MNDNDRKAAETADAGNIDEKLKYYMSLPYKLVIIPDTMEGGYGACYPDLPGCITTAGKAKDIVSMAEDAKREWIYTMLEAGERVPGPTWTPF